MSLTRGWSRLGALVLVASAFVALGVAASADDPPLERVFVSSTSSGSVGGVSFANEDILVYDQQTETWTLHFDGSARGLLPGWKLDGFHVVGDGSDGSVLFSLAAPRSIPGVGPVDDSDVVAFDPVNGFSLFFDGSDYGLSSPGEDVDALSLDQNGRLVISTVGSGSVPAGSFADEDLLRLVDSGLELYLDGSAVGLAAGPEDVVGVSVGVDGSLLLNTLGPSSVGPVSGGRSDVLQCELGDGEGLDDGPISSCLWSVVWTAESVGFGAEAVNGLSVVEPPTSPPPDGTTTSTTADLPTTTTSTTSLPTTTTSVPSTTTSLPSATSTTTTTSTTTSTVPSPDPAIEPGSRFFVSTSGGTVGGVTFTDEDIVRRDPNGAWSMLVDGSDLGLNASLKIDGVSVRPDGTVFFSLTAPADLPDVGNVDDSDVIKLVPTSLGPVTAGTLSLFFDGSAHGLSSSGEDVDAVGFDRNGNLLVSTKGAAAGPFGRTADEDVLVFDGTTLSLFLDGSAVGLRSAPENVVGLSVHESGAVQLSTVGNHSVAGASGDRSDVLQCMPTNAAPITDCVWLSSFDGGAAGYGAETIAAMSATSISGYFVDFDQPLGSDWDIYDSVGHAGWGLRRPSAVTVGADPAAERGGLLTITAKMGSGSEAGQLVSGGIKLRFPQTYGEYLVRARVDPDPDGVTSGVVLLWPESNQHPRDGEINILESWANRETRTPMESNLHWLRPGAEPPFTLADDYKAQIIHPGVDGTDWHVFNLVWRPDLVSVAVDGGTPVVLSTDPAEIAAWNMEPTIQLDAFDAFDAPGVQPTLSGEVLLMVDYLIVLPPA